MRRNRIIFFILLVGSGFLVFYIPNYITSLFYHMMVSLVVLSFAHLMYSYIKVTISQKLEPMIVEHSSNTKYECAVFNETVIPFASVTVNFLFNASMFRDQLEPMTFSMRALQRQVFTYDLKCRYRGVYAVGVEKIQVKDFLNIFCFSNSGIEEKNMTVLPKLTPLPNFSIEPRAQSNIQSYQNKSSQMASSLVDVRQFQQGDSLKRIHWKLSAHHDELLVRNLERSAENSTLMFLDTLRGTHDIETNMIIEDKLMEAYVSIVNQFLIQKHIIELNYHNIDTKNITYYTRDDFNEFFLETSTIAFRSNEPVTSLIDEYFMTRHSEHNLKDIFIFTCNQLSFDDHPILNRLLNNQCSLHIIVSTTDEEKAGSYRSNEGIYYYLLAPSSEIDTVFVKGVV